MSDELSAELQELIAAVEIVSDSEFRLGGRSFAVPGPRPLLTASRGGGSDAASPRAALAGALADQLYSRWYARCTADEAPHPDPVAQRDHLVRLHAARSGRGQWEPGWIFRGARGDGTVAVEGYDVVFRTAAAEVRPHPGELRVGDSCRVRVPGELRHLVPGFYCVVGEADRAASEELPWLPRIYWHLVPGAAPEWIQAVAAGLDRAGVPFRLKVVADPRFYLRADAGVLTLDPGDYDSARPVLAEVYDRLHHHLRPSVPALTRRLAPGVGAAEGAADGSSFGGSRCELIAGALVAAGVAEAAGRQEAVAAAFRRQGLDPLHPYRAPGSRASYAQLGSNAVTGAAPGAAGTVAEAESEPVDRIAVAASIADTLCRRAVRSGRRCGWAGKVFVVDPQGAGWVPALGALKSDLYGGTAGIALFLAEVARQTGEASYRDVSAAAARQALGSVASEPGLYRPLGFYEGRLGIGWAARRVARLSGDEELEGAAVSLIDELVRNLLEGRCAGGGRDDLLAGGAGAVLALLRLHEETASGSLLEAARVAGRELLPATDALTAPAALTGLAHGAAGPGLALLELAVATGEAEPRDAAARCFDYEERCFDPAARNWPDFRELPRDDSGRVVGPASFMTAWCHGAAGIALSRLRAMEVDGARAAGYEVAARAGLATTARAIERALSGAPGDLSLCHGLAGLAEVAGFGGRVLEEPELERLAAAAIERVASLRAAGAGTAPSSARPYDPSLLTGDAGVGYALLRFAAPHRVATLLLPGAGAEEPAAGRVSAPDLVPRSSAALGGSGP